MFAFQTLKNILLIFLKKGIGHGDELLYLFYAKLKMNNEDEIFTQKMCNIWTTFATHG